MYVGTILAHPHPQPQPQGRDTSSDTNGLPRWMSVRGHSWGLVHSFTFCSHIIHYWALEAKEVLKSFGLTHVLVFRPRGSKFYNLRMSQLSTETNYVCGYELGEREMSTIRDSTCGATLEVTDEVDLIGNRGDPSTRALCNWYRSIKLFANKLPLVEYTVIN